MRDAGVNPEDPNLNDIVGKLLTGTVVVEAATTKASSATTKVTPATTKAPPKPRIAHQRIPMSNEYPPVTAEEFIELGLEEKPLLELGYAFEQRGGTAQMMIDKFIARWNYPPKAFRLMNKVVMLGYIADPANRIPEIFEVSN